MDDNLRRIQANGKLQTALFERIHRNDPRAVMLEREAAETLSSTEIGRYHVNVAITLAKMGRFDDAMEALSNRADLALTFSPTRTIELLIADGYIQWLKEDDASLIDALDALRAAGELIDQEFENGNVVDSNIVETYNVNLATVLMKIQGSKMLTAHLALYFYESPRK